ncbi:MAG: glycosyltransferase [Lachnospiraceae bacterium]|nr:glycosyltransferase [Lachnospiraceae bacterium]
MKILFYRYNSICEPAFIKHFTDAGVTVVEETLEMTNKSATGAELIERVSKTLSEDNFVFVMSINFFPTLSAVCNIFKIPYISIIVDCPIWELYSKEVRNPVNRIFVFDKIQYKRIKDFNPDCIFHLPLCADIETFGNAIGRADEKTKNRFSADISFIGSLYTEKCAYNNITTFSPYIKGFVDGLIKAFTGLFGYNSIYEALNDDVAKRIATEAGLEPLPENYNQDLKAIVADNIIGIKISEQDRLLVLKELSETYGYNIDLYTGSDTSMLPKVHNRGLAKSLTEMPVIFNRSKINLNITTKTIQTGISQRVFDVLACHGFLISNYQEELFEFFTPGKDLETFSSIPELADKISYYLSHENERLAIANSGYETVTKLHSVDVRLNQILSFI